MSINVELILQCGSKVFSAFLLGPINLPIGEMTRNIKWQ